MSTSAPGDPPSAGRRRRRNLLVVALAVVAIAVLAAGGYGLWYVLVGPSAPAAVNSAPPALPGGAAVTAPASLDGTWNVNTSLGSIGAGTTSFVGYRVQEQLVGVGGHTAVGRTTEVTGSLTLAGAVVENVQITADLTALVSDSPQRDNQLRSQALQTDTFPTATFKTTRPSTWARCRPRARRSA